MSNWTSPIIVVPKKEECMDSSNNQSSSRIQTAHQIKANGSLGNVISNYPLPTIDSILACFNSCKFFPIIDFRSGYHHN